MCPLQGRRYLHGRVWRRLLRPVRVQNGGLHVREDLDEKLCADFPLLYRDRHGDMSQTCMVFGFPSDGWEPLIRRLSEKLEPMITALPEEEREMCRAAQVKEKFGRLRFHLDGATDEMQDLIDAAEKASASICEVCGDPGRLHGNYWVHTLCDRHA